MSGFPPGHTGRPKGTRNKLTREFIAALAKEFEEHGEGAIRIVRIEDPATFLKLIASLTPKEVDVSVAAGLDDSELESMIEALRAKVLEQAAPPLMIEAKPIKVSDERH